MVFTADLNIHWTLQIYNYFINVNYTSCSVAQIKNYSDVLNIDWYKAKGAKQHFGAKRHGVYYGAVMR